MAALADALRDSIVVPSASVGMSLLAVLVIVGPLAAWWLAGRRRAAGVVAALALLPIVALTMTPTSRDMRIGCAIDWSPQLTTAEPLWNVLLFVPFGLALAVAWRRPVLAVAAGSATSFAIELVQAIVTPIGRSCDTSDWVANTAGTLIGVLLAGVGVGLARMQRRDAERAAAQATPQRTLQH